MNEAIRNALIEAIWHAMDDTDGDESAVRDQIEQAIGAWSPE